MFSGKSYGAKVAFEEVHRHLGPDEAESFQMGWHFSQSEGADAFNFVSGRIIGGRIGCWPA